jgi:hypothetical protein
MLNIWGLFAQKPISLCYIDFAFIWTQNLHELKTGKFHQSQQPSRRLGGAKRNPTH